MAQDVQIANPLTNRRGRSYDGARHVLNAASRDNSLPRKSRNGRVISEPRNDIGSDDRHARAGVEDDGDDNRRLTVRGFQ